MVLSGTGEGGRKHTGGSQAFKIKEWIVISDTASSTDGNFHVSVWLSSGLLGVHFFFWSNEE